MFANANANFVLLILRIFANYFATFPQPWPHGHGRQGVKGSSRVLHVGQNADSLISRLPSDSFREKVDSYDNVHSLFHAWNDVGYMQQQATATGTV